MSANPTNIMACGHSAACLVSSDEGTSYCAGCQVAATGSPERVSEQRCLPDCQGDCPVCLPPEEYDKLHGKTTNLAHDCNRKRCNDCVEHGGTVERARIVRRLADVWPDDELWSLASVIHEIRRDVT